jgi:hypothetical protein
MHYKRQIGVHVRRSLPKLIHTLQGESPDRLLPTALIIRHVAGALDVTGGVVRKHLTDAVADGDLLEILVRRDWLLVPPYAREQIPLYAVPDGDVYKMVCERPASRGSNGISFLTSPRGYDVLIDEMVNLIPTG